MDPKQRRDLKSEALHRHGALNPTPERVTDPLFEGDEFFDSRDLVQVKYEMLRLVRTTDEAVSRACAAFGCSRPTFYKAQAAFTQRGLPGLVPSKRGPRGGHKLTREALERLDEALAADPSLTTSELARIVGERFGVTVHARTIQRALARKKGGRR
jgi:transposase